MRQKVKPRNSAKLTEALRRMGNPYAKLQVEEVDSQQIPLDFYPMTEAERQYVRVLGNQYASLSIAREVDAPSDTADQALQLNVASDQQVQEPDFLPMTAAKRRYVRMLENPYASLSIGEEAVVTKESAAEPEGKGAVSKRDFEAECRRNFGQYIPSLQKGRIRDEHAAFISRNNKATPEVRFELLAGLRKYDLSNSPGLQAQFNRERVDLTAVKLAKIEQTVYGKSR